MLKLPDVIVTPDAGYRVTRAWPRSCEHCLIEVRSGDGVTMAGQWFANAEPAEELAASLGEEAILAGTAVIQPGGVDSKLPQLAKLLRDPRHELLAHRSGRRAVVRRLSVDGSVECFLKLVRRRRAADVAQRGQQVADLIGDQIIVPRLLENSDVDSGLLAWSVVPGETLYDLGRENKLPPPEAARVWRAAGAAVLALHRADASQVVEHHGVDEELYAIRRLAEPAVAHGFLPAGPVAAALHAVESELRADASQSPVGVLHRDLHDKQLLVGDEIGMIDIDTLATGERAVDVANLLAHLELRQMQGNLSAAEALAARGGFLRGVEVDEIPLQRTRAYQRAAMLRLACVYAFRPQWRDVAALCLQQTQDEIPAA